MLRRKIETFLEQWKQSGKALLVDGARQVGKTFTLRQFAETHFSSSVYLNLYENKRAVQVLKQSIDSTDFLRRLSVFAEKPLVKGETVIFLDEIQELEEFDLVTMIKFLVDEGSYRFMFSGSMLGVELYDIKSWPVGYLLTTTMHPLDFEEFLWANGISSDIIDRVRICFERCNAIEDYIHEKMMRLFQYYLLVGGMPDAVNAFVKTGDFHQVNIAHKAIQDLNRKDIAKYASQNDKLRIKEIFNLIPEELNSKSKRFMLNEIDGLKRGDGINASFRWLQGAGVAIPVYNTKEPAIPLRVNQERTVLKLFMKDVGLLTYELMDTEVKSAILSGDLTVNEGSICENACAQLLLAHGFEHLFYFNSKKIGEIDFMVEYKHHVLPIEVKSGSRWRSHAALDNLMSIPNYAIDDAFIFTPCNVEQDGRLTYFPIYMIDFLQKHRI